MIKTITYTRNYNCNRGDYREDFAVIIEINNNDDAQTQLLEAEALIDQNIIVRKLEVELNEVNITLESDIKRLNGYQIEELRQRKEYLQTQILSIKS